jgi:hypothetical protein
MKSEHQPVSLAVRGHLSPQFRSYSRCAFRIPNAFTGPPDFRKSPDRPLSVASVSPVECLPATHYPPLTTHSPLTTFRINTCKSVSKQRTLTPFRINTYKKTGEGVPLQAPVQNRHLPVSNSGNARRMLHVAPLSPVHSLDCGYFPSSRGCTPPAHYTTHRPLPTLPI